MNNQEHIVFLTPGFPKDEEDSQCIPALQIFFKELKKQFSGKISIISFQYPENEKVYSWNEVDVYTLGGNNKKLKKLITWKKAKGVFKKITIHHKVTRIHSFWMGECAYIGQQLAAQFHLPHTCTLMGQDVLSTNTYFKKIEHLPELISLSKFHAQELEKNHHLSSKIIPWGIEENDMSLPEKTIDVIGVGSLIPLKAFDEFIEVIKQVSQTHPQLKCKIVGQGVLNDDLSNQIQKYELNEYVELTGSLSYHQTQELIASSKILLHLSNFESFGMVVIEALSYQTQVLSKSVGIAAEINEVIKINTIEEAVKQVNKLLSNYKPQKAPSFLIKDTLEQYLQLFNE